MEALVFDTETTGLVSSRLVKKTSLPEIIEFYGARCTFNKQTGDFKIIEELELLIKPDRMINEYKEGKQNIAKITGITNAMLADAPPLQQVANQMFELIERAPLVIAHNLHYDEEVMDIAATRQNYQIKWPPGICTVEATAYLRSERLTLTNLYAMLFNEKFTPHRAKADTTALIRCCAKLYQQGVI